MPRAKPCATPRGTGAAGERRAAQPEHRGDWEHAGLRLVVEDNGVGVGGK
jgi:hypothetical protein